MAVKEKALRRLTEKLTAAGITFALGGDWLLSQADGAWTFHGFDVVVTEEDAPRADQVLTRLGMRHPEETRDALTVSYHFDGADVTLRAGMRFGGAQARFDAGSVAGYAELLGVRVPLMYLEDWVVYDTLDGKEARARGFAAAAVKAGVHGERLSACIDGDVPEAARELLAHGA